MKQAKRYNHDKPDLHYLDPWYDALCEVARVCMKGAEKYERGNYLLGQPYSELQAAARRHGMKFGSFRYPDRDVESNCHHIAHQIWNLLQLLQHEVGIEKSGPLWDDRLKPPGWGEHNACTEFETIPPAERPWNASTHGLIRPTAGEPGHGYPAHVIEPIFLGGDDDSRDPADVELCPGGYIRREPNDHSDQDYEQETADMEAAAQGTGRKAHPPWQDAVEAWLTGEPGEPEPEGVTLHWNPADHLPEVAELPIPDAIEVTSLADERPKFWCRTHGDPLNGIGSCKTCQRIRSQQAHIRAKL